MAAVTRLAALWQAVLKHSRVVCKFDRDALVLLECRNGHSTGVDVA
jgi:hypothetical protein